MMFRGGGNNNSEMCRTLQIVDYLFVSVGENLLVGLYIKCQRESMGQDTIIGLLLIHQARFFVYCQTMVPNSKLFVTFPVMSAIFGVSYFQIYAIDPRCQLSIMNIGTRYIGLICL